MAAAKPGNHVCCHIHDNQIRTIHVSVNVQISYHRGIATNGITSLSPTTFSKNPKLLAVFVFIDVSHAECKNLTRPLVDRIACGNRIRELPEALFSANPELLTADFSNNRIVGALPPKLFNATTKLQSMYVNHLIFSNAASINNLPF